MRTLNCVLPTLLTKLTKIFFRSIALRYFDFAPPKFVVGNAFNLVFGDSCIRYDRIYVGAACDSMDDVKRFAKFLKIGGLMVAPLESNVGLAPIY